MNYLVPQGDGVTRRTKLLSTGIAGFDGILGGGLPENGLYLLQGLAGSGKTTLACQIGFGLAKQGKKVLVLTLIAESHAKMMSHFSNFRFYDEALIGNEIVMMSGYKSLREGGLRDLLQLVSTLLAETKPELLIVDGFRSVRDAAPSDMDLSEFMHSLNSLVYFMGCTTFLLSPMEGNLPESENTLVDGVIELSQLEQGMRLIREIKIYKLRGGNHMLGKHVFEVNSDGIVIYPRLEAVATRSHTTPGASGELVSCGIPTWDKIIGGGVGRGSITNLLGSPGVGKSSMGLHFIEAGLRAREKCLIVGFYESAPRLIEKAKRLGLDLTNACQAGDLEIIWSLPLEGLIDSLATQMFANIEARGVTRLFIDGVEGLRDMVMHPGRAPTFLMALANELRIRGVTTFFTEQLSYFNEATLTNDSSASALYENIFLLKYISREDVNYRQISVIKLRENEYNAANHLLTISSSGLAVNHMVSTLRRVSGHALATGNKNGV